MRENNPLLAENLIKWVNAIDMLKILYTEKRSIIRRFHWIFSLFLENKTSKVLDNSVDSAQLFNWYNWKMDISFCLHYSVSKEFYTQVYKYTYIYLLHPPTPPLVPPSPGHGSLAKEPIFNAVYPGSIPG